ncbi:Phosphatidylglycerophosphate synthase [Cohaesibacter sp. ES.047]|uniref:CDP-alcohol phosphatidyltransferase family protein n=1 Tax=Cohaesibacter sp. ES.047 TaxID=1798205 RepID=UPI000BB982E4|nr:CDP-alcohol phosphatidyltransferase family protein [Cohaesibacter sp. ES.047]SNY91877.1 Phosphatidylglycerophosphate synthase [Cohaesibacter sp. ES.047]
MLDARLRRFVDPPVNALGQSLARLGVTANQITLAGLLLGVAAATAIALEAYWTGLAILLVSRLMDGLDGAVARVKGKTDLGGYLDIVFDFIFYGLIPLGFAVARPENALPAAVLLTAFYANGASFLAYAIMAEKHKLSTVSHGSKSLYFTGGLAEAGETYAVFAAFCLFPDAFAWIAYGFAAVTAITTGSRILLAVQVFGQKNTAKGGERDGAD